MSSAAEKMQAALPYSGGYFQQVGSEEAHTVESFERRISGTDTSEPRREFSTNQYTERRTYGRDENGDLVVKIEKDPKEPVRPVTPVEPVMPIGNGYPGEHLLKPIKPMETLPLQIPRIETPSRQHNIDYNNQYTNYGGGRRSASAAPSPRSVTIQADLSPRSIDSGPLHYSPRSSSSASSRVSAGGTPMKKVIKKTRLVSIYDGRPVSPYVETVTYEPKYEDRYSAGYSRHLNGYDRSRSASRLSAPSPLEFGSRRVSASEECSYLVVNPLYSDY